MLADVVEHAGWTNGSLHNAMLRHDPGWIAVYMIDVAAFISALAIMAMCMAAYASLILANWTKGKIASNRKQLVKKHD